ncbi:MAG: hypothetical protein JXL84_12745 [Deltaproteobacteria bacterium]|nr:hypothetical protein [Deltaproteobacteria bacterium]
MARQVFQSKVGFKTILQVLGLLTLFTLTQWNSLDGPFERDEGEYSYAAWIMKEGLVPYRDSFMQKPPMIIYTYRLAQILSDQAFWPPRLLGSFSVLLTAILVGFIARKEYGPTAGWISVWIFLPMWCLPHLLPFAANTEKFMILPMMAALSIYIFFGRRASGWTWFAAGACATLSLLYKPIVLPVLLFIFGVWAWESRRSDPKAAGTLKRLLFALAGAVAVTGVTLLHFLLQGALDDLWESCVTFNRAYAEALTWGPEYFLRKIKILIRFWWVLFLLLLWFVIRRPGRWWFHLCLFLLAVVSAYKDPNGHYYLMILPFWALIGAGAIVSLLQAAEKRPPAERTLFAVVTVLLVDLLLCWPVRHQFIMSPLELSLRTYGRETPFQESPFVAGRVAAMTRPEDLVFVAGSEPQILYYAKRKSPTRFVIMYPLMLPSPYAEKYQRETLQAIQARPPKVIVLTNSPYSWFSSPRSPTVLIPFLNSLFQSGTYQLEAGFLWEHGEATWVESIDAETAKRCSLLLFKHRTSSP